VPGDAAEAEATTTEAKAATSAVNANRRCMPYLLSYGSEEQKRHYLPPAIAGEMLLGICMTEPGTGSDLANVQTRAVRDGDHWVINGTKIFCTSGLMAAEKSDGFVVVWNAPAGNAGQLLEVTDGTLVSQLLVEHGIA